jgi:23S rRNA (adenine2503-C2)-methyltransferase
VGCGEDGTLTEQVLLTEMDYEGMVTWFAELGEPPFRARQVFEWIYRSLVDDFSSMTNLPALLRQSLLQKALLCSLQPMDSVTSADGLATKVLFRLRDGETIESVWMQYEGRQTVCVSSQVGCAVGCPFCATGQGGFHRNLTSGEMVEQILYFARKANAQEEGITNVVFMGMGEPLANYDASWDAVRRLNDARGANLGARRFTLSTAGIVPGIERLAKEDLAVGLAVSLHAAQDALRDRLVPLNKRYPLSVLIPACLTYAEHTGRRVSFEYALIDGVNNSPEQAVALGHLLHGLLCHVNLIPLNPTAQCPYQPSNRDQVVAFRKELNRLGIANTIRLGRGIDIQAGCGQLRLQSAGKTSEKP